MVSAGRDASGSAPFLPRQLPTERPPEQGWEPRSLCSRTKQLLPALPKQQTRAKRVVLPQHGGGLPARLDSAFTGDSAASKRNWKPGLRFFYLFSRSLFQNVSAALSISCVTSALSLCTGIRGTDVTMSLFQHWALIWLLKGVFQGSVYPKENDINATSKISPVQPQTL